MRGVAVANDAPSPPGPSYPGMMTSQGNWKSMVFESGLRQVAQASPISSS
jgi:hypothetical protein